MPRLRFVSTVEGVNTIELEEPLITIGRGINNVVCIEDANISKHHALLIQEDDTYKLIDLHSVNGTSVNGQRITVARLKEGDAVRIGYLDLMYEIGVVGPRPAALGAPGKPRPPAAAPALGAQAPIGSRPRLGFGVSGKPATAPAEATVEIPPSAPATPPPIPVEVHAAAPAVPAKEEDRMTIQVPADKKHLVTGPPPTPAGGLGGPPRLKPTLHHDAPPNPPPPQPVEAPAPPPVEQAQPEAAAEQAAPSSEQPAAPAEQHPTTGPKKLGLASGGGAPKFKLKRE